jgi:hypothetical protein
MLSVSEKQEAKGVSRKQRVFPSSTDAEKQKKKKRLIEVH